MKLTIVALLTLIAATVAVESSDSAFEDVSLESLIKDRLALALNSSVGSQQLSESQVATALEANAGCGVNRKRFHEDNVCCEKEMSSNGCDVIVSFCVELAYGSLIKTKLANCWNPKAIMKIRPTLSVTITPQNTCTGNLEFSEEREKTLYSGGIAKVAMSMGYKFQFNSGLDAAVTLTVPTRIVVGFNWAGTGASIDTPTLTYTGSSDNPSVKAEVYVGVGMSALELVGIGAEATIKTDGYVDVTPSGIDPCATMTAVVDAKAALQFPTIELPSFDICQHDFSFGSFEMPSIGASFNIYSQTLQMPGTCATPSVHSHTPHSHSPAHVHNPHIHNMDYDACGESGCTHSHAPHTPHSHAPHSHVPHSHYVPTMSDPDCSGGLVEEAQGNNLRNAQISSDAARKAGC